MSPPSPVTKKGAARVLQVVPREFCLGSLASVAGGPGVFQAWGDPFEAALQ